MWPNERSTDVAAALQRRFSRLRIAAPPSEQEQALAGVRGVFCRGTAPRDALRRGDQRAHMAFRPDATCALDLHDERAAEVLLQQLGLPPGGFLCAVLRLRYTQYWQGHTERFTYDPTQDAVNQEHAERDQAKVRAAITAWVRELNTPVLLRRK